MNRRAWIHGALVGVAVLFVITACWWLFQAPPEHKVPESTSGTPPSHSTSPLLNVSPSERTLEPAPPNSSGVGGGLLDTGGSPDEPIVEGRVLTPLGAPDAGRRVVLADDTGEVLAEQQTDSTGHFAFRAVHDPAAPLCSLAKVVSASAPGWRTTTELLETMVLQGRHRVARAVELVFEEGVSVQGQVVWDTGEPCEDAVLRIGEAAPTSTRGHVRPVGPLQAVRTDPRGRFVIDGLPADALLHAEVAAPGMPVASKAWFQTPADDRSPHAGLRFIVERPGALRVHVQGTEDLPVSVAARTFVALRDPWHPDCSGGWRGRARLVEGCALFEGRQRGQSFEISLWVEGHEPVPLATTVTLLEPVTEVTVQAPSSLAERPAESPRDAWELGVEFLLPDGSAIDLESLPLYGVSREDIRSRLQAPSGRTEEFHWIESSHGTDLDWPATLRVSLFGQEVLVQDVRPDVTVRVPLDLARLAVDHRPIRFRGVDERGGDVYVTIVEIHPRSPPGPVKICNWSRNGTFAYLAPGDYLAHASCWPIAAACDLRFTVGPGTPDEHVLMFETERVLQGRVRPPPGPGQRLEVNVLADPERSVEQRAHTTPLGFYHCRGLPAGRTTVRVTLYDRLRGESTTECFAAEVGPERVTELDLVRSSSRPAFPLVVQLSGCPSARLRVATATDSHAFLGAVFDGDRVLLPEPPVAFEALPFVRTFHSMGYAVRRARRGPFEQLPGPTGLILALDFTRD